VVKQWNSKIAEGDAYLFVSPEYNHGIPAVLKNAIDSVFATFVLRGKPAAYVGYSGSIRANGSQTTPPRCDQERWTYPVRASGMSPWIITVTGVSRGP